jgi:hypothetical protein
MSAGSGWFMSASQIVETSMSVLSTVLAFAEVLVLFASAIGLVVAAASLVIKKLLSLTDAAIEAGSPRTQSYIKTLNPLGSVMIGRPARRIPGAHNEHF